MIYGLLSAIVLLGPPPELNIRGRRVEPHEAISTVHHKWIKFMTIAIKQLVATYVYTVPIYYID